jgi:predicted RNase H-like HicB family nuclease
MKPADQYHRFVYWSEEDGCYLGTCPDLCGPCCHGDDANEVFRELGEIVEEHIALFRSEGRALPLARTRPMQELASA